MKLPDAIESLFTSGVTDVLIVGSNQAQVDRGFGLESIPVDFGTEADLQTLAIELALEAGARADIAKPVADFPVENYRVQVALPFGISNKTLISIRRHPKGQVTLEHLHEVEMITESQKRYLEVAVAERKSMLISGPTGSGKTTLLSALIQKAQDRTVCIEQTPELNPSFPAFSLAERESNQEGIGLIDAQALLAHALRMRPDRIVLGEVRGREFGSLLLAMNNGHSALGTLHAKSLELLPQRLLVLGKLSGFEPELTAALLCNSVDLVVQLEVNPTRKVSAIAKLDGHGQYLRAVEIEL